MASGEAGEEMATNVLDGFEDVAGWMPIASGLAELTISRESTPGGHAMRLDFDFKGGGGFVVARKEFSLPMPESFAFTFHIRGAAPANKFEFKLADPSGRNVWWYHEDAFEITAEGRPMRIRSSDIEFAWGPSFGAPLPRLGAIEFVITAGPGGRGTVWIEDFRFEDTSFRSTPAVQASTSLAGHPPECAVDRSADTSWRSAGGSGPQWLLVDFRQEREYGGLVIDWVPGAGARAFDVETSSDGREWTTAYSAGQADGDRAYVYLPRCSSRCLRLNLREPSGDGGFGIVGVEVKPFDFSRSLNRFFEYVARSERRGRHPRYFHGEQSYWTPVGIPDSVTQGIFNEEGLLEVDRGTFSIEPFLHLDGQLLTWADAAVTLELEGGYLPIPSSIWRVGDLTLRITSFATGDPERAVLYVRYRVENGGERPRQALLFAAVRPFQVTPPWQAFKDLGGASRTGELEYDGGVLWVGRARVVIPLTPPISFGAAAFAQSGGITGYLADGALPPQRKVEDDFGHASGAFRYDLDVPPGSSAEVFLAIPFGTDRTVLEELARTLPASTTGPLEFERAAAQWRKRLDLVQISLPAASRAHAETMKTAAAHILINRDGPALQPGPRRYTRSWIRDGAIMAAALLRLGCDEDARRFVRWYAAYQADDGNVPCCVDREGPDWLVEHDSHGELIFAVMECYRFTRDRAFLAEMWPAALKAANYIEALRATRLTDEYRTPDKRARYGLLPESASHEGYLAHPVHSYWDDFWALRGLRDAAAMARVLGHDAQADRIAALCRDFCETVEASVRTTIAERQLDYVPGSVEWADFDPTATSNAVSLLDELGRVPRDTLDLTFTKYLEGFRKRRSNEIDWSNYTAYEIRIFGALVYLGRRDEANELADFFLGDRRPLPWNQWPEISWRDPRSPGHIGDVPHTWIGAEYILALRSMLLYEVESDSALVLAAGVPGAWLDGGFEVAVRDLPTYYGRLGFTLRRDDAGVVRVSLSGDLEPCRIVLRPPLPGPLARVEVDGVPVDGFTADSVTIRACPANVVMVC